MPEESEALRIWRMRQAEAAPLPAKWSGCAAGLQPFAIDMIDPEKMLNAEKYGVLFEHSDGSRCTLKDCKGNPDA